MESTILPSPSTPAVIWPELLPHMEARLAERVKVARVPRRRGRSAHDGPPPTILEQRRIDAKLRGR